MRNKDQSKRLVRRYEAVVLSCLACKSCFLSSREEVIDGFAAEKEWLLYFDSVPATGFPSLMVHHNGSS